MSPPALRPRSAHHTFALVRAPGYRRNIVPVEPTFSHSLFLPRLHPFSGQRHLTIPVAPFLTVLSGARSSGAARRGSTTLITAERSTSWLPLLKLNAGANRWLPGAWSLSALWIATVLRFPSALLAAMAC